MAQVVLGGVGQAVGGGLGQAIGSALGSLADRALIGALMPARQVGPRLEGLKVQSSADGASMAFVLGQARVTGQIIWAARFREGRSEGGTKTGGRTETRAYSLSFAVALCEGPIDGIGRVWADGQPMSLADVAMRVHRGEADQSSDPLIEAVEGEAPAYRGTAYVVFEDLPLGPYGNRPPQLSFEVFRRVGGGLEGKLEGVCLIPGAGEFVLATEPVFRRDGLTRATVENLHQSQGRSNLEASLDQLAIRFPNLKRVSLVVGWFGGDLRAGHCRIRPGVESEDRITEPQAWSVAGLARHEAHLVSQSDGAPAYGGTPSDESVRQAVSAIRARGWKATLYPFVFMDIPSGNGLPDPYGGVEQAAYPWRGRIRGEDGEGAAEEITALFGGATDWGLCRMALHYAEIAAETGAEGLLIGSELRGITWTRDEAGGYPAVTQLCDLVEACREIVGPDVELSYAADWSEYAGHRPDDGSGDVLFHMDPLWSHADVDHVSIDWYPPMGDWRGDEGGLDGLTWSGPADRGYLAAQVAGGEGHDWFYVDASDRADQTRTPISDAAHGEDWVFRVKDLAGWWSNAHHDRPGGLRSEDATGWVPGMKPIRLSELGCAAVDRGGNAPNLFLDPKSAESALPPQSTGARDDLMQRRLLEAVLDHYADAGNNPVSEVYGGPMLSGVDAWCWDARPYPAFPAREEVWRDASAWRCGHWLNGRGGGEGVGLLRALLARGGLTDAQVAIEGGERAVAGYVVDRPMAVRDTVGPLIDLLGLTAAERGGGLMLRGVAVVNLDLAADALALDDADVATVRTRALEPTPDRARVRFIDEAGDYQIGSVTALAEGSAGGGGSLDVEVPAVCGAGAAMGLARRRLAMAEAAEGLAVRLGPLEALRLEAADVVTVEGFDGRWRVGRIDHEEAVTAVLAPVVEVGAGDLPENWRVEPGRAPTGRPFLQLLDLPSLFDALADERPFAVAAGEPWTLMRLWSAVSDGEFVLRGDAERSATVGRVVEAVARGPVGRWDRLGSIVVDLEGAPPISRGEQSVLEGRNILAVRTAVGWEVLQFRQVELLEGGLCRLSGLLRGQRGTETEAEAGIDAGTLAVVLDDAVVRPDARPGELNLTTEWRAAPVGRMPSGPETASTAFVWSGRARRPMRPCHLRRADVVGGGWAFNWIPRNPGDLDGWGEPDRPSTGRFRLRLNDGEADLLTAEGEDAVATISASQIAAAFPAGAGPDARALVAQFDPVGGWGPEAQIRL
jgi:hypothetical protein